MLPKCKNPNWTEPRASRQVLDDEPIRLDPQNTKNCVLEYQTKHQYSSNESTQTSTFTASSGVEYIIDPDGNRLTPDSLLDGL